MGAFNDSGLPIHWSTKTDPSRRQLGQSRQGVLEGGVDLLANAQRTLSSIHRKPPRRLDGLGVPSRDLKLGTADFNAEEGRVHAGQWSGGDGACASRAL